MRRLHWIAIVLLIVGAGGLGYKLRADWRSFRAANDPVGLKVTALPAAPASSGAQTRDYTVVAQQNPFHPERNDALPPPPPVEQVKTVGPPPLVYGSMLLGKEKYALMGTEADPKPHKVNEGDDFGGYKLVGIKPQSVVLEADGSKSEVMFYNALTRLKRDAQKTQATGGGAAPTVTASAASTTTTATAAEPHIEVPPPLPPAIPGATAPAGKVLQMTPFGPMWVDKK